MVWCNSRIACGFFSLSPIAHQRCHLPPLPPVPRKENSRKMLKKNQSKNSHATSTKSTVLSRNNIIQKNSLQTMHGGSNKCGKKTARQYQNSILTGRAICWKNNDTVDLKSVHGVKFNPCAILLPSSVSVLIKCSIILL